MDEGLLPAERPHPSLNVDRISELIARKDALSGTVRLANQLKLAIVVVDADEGMGRSLYRLQDDDKG
jgi:hypothetical protein